jgi:hypothetical protein
MATQSLPIHVAPCHQVRTRLILSDPEPLIDSNVVASRTSPRREFGGIFAQQHHIQGQAPQSSAVEHIATNV